MIPGQNIFCFTLIREGITDAESEWIRDYAAWKGLKIYAAGGVQRYADRLITCSPFELLSYFANAQEVITDTFHGTIFSVITRRPFVSIIRKSIGGSYGNEEKLTDLLKRLDLSDRYVRSIYETHDVMKREINYQKTEQIIAVQRRKTEEYFRKENREDRIMNTIETAGLDCVGCRSCEHACPMHAITMGEDNEGFLFPKINREICVLCGQCLKKCPVCSDNFPCSSPLEVYAFQSGDKKALMQSASGGVSDAAAEAVLQLGGVIYGAAFHTDPSDGKILSVRHVEVTDSVDRYRIRSSKYVQSDTGDSYKLARNRLKNGQTVLFTGTPCQIAGLYSFLGGDHPCLYTLDLICHGVPSPALLRQYLKSQSHCMGGSITDMNFRSKEGKGWGTQYRLKLGSEKQNRIPAVCPGQIRISFHEW